MHIFFGFIHTGHIGKCGFNLILTQQTCLTLAESHRATTTSSTTLHLTHEKHENSENQKNREGRYQQLHPEALFFGLATLNTDIVIEQVAHQTRVGNIGTYRFEGAAISTFAFDRQTLNDDTTDTTGLHLLNKSRVIDAVFFRGRIEILEHRQ